MAVTISVCMIVKNEEKVLERCLKGVLLFADELIIVDTGSADKTKEIAARYTDRVYEFEWGDDFAAARNYAFSLASCDYIMWMDADDVIDQENAKKVCRLKETLKEDAVLMFYERTEYELTLYYLRMVKNSAMIRWRGAIHEYLTGYQSVLETEIVIKHQKENPLDFRRNIRIMEKLTEEELINDFALCGNCYLDCILDQSFEEADYYLSLAGKTQEPVCKNRVNTCVLIGMVLVSQKKYKEALEWGELLLRETMHKEELDHETCISASAFSLQAVKSAVNLKKIKEAWCFNELAICFDPYCAPALINRRILEEKLQR